MGCFATLRRCSRHRSTNTRSLLGNLLSEDIPGLYTREGFYHAVLPLLADAIDAVRGESWVLGESMGAGRAATTDDVLALYYDDYAQRWEEILSDLSVQPMRNMEQAAEVLNFRSGTASPLKLVWQAIDRETQLTKPAEAGGPPAASKTSGLSPGRSISAASAQLGRGWWPGADGPPPPGHHRSLPPDKSHGHGAAWVPR